MRLLLTNLKVQMDSEQIQNISSWIPGNLSNIRFETLASIVVMVSLQK